MFIGREAERGVLERQIPSDERPADRAVWPVEGLENRKPHVPFLCTQTTDKVQLRETPLYNQAEHEVKFRGKICFMKLRNRYLAFSSKQYRYLRLLLAIVVAASFYVSALTGYLWLYCASFVLLMILVAAMSFLYSYVAFSDVGIKLRYGLWKTYEIEWEDVLCCGTFFLPGVGTGRNGEKEEYIYFSKKPISYSRLCTSDTIPPQSNNFIYFIKQDSILSAIQELWHDKKANMLFAEPDTESDNVHKGNHRAAVFAAALGLTCAVCAIAYVLSLDGRWIVAAGLCIFGLFETINVN